VDAASGELVSVTDYVAHATYRVLPIWKASPAVGDFETLVDPEDKTASPYGWRSTDGVKFNNFTAGNNAVSAIASTTAHFTAPDEFIYPYTNGTDPFTESHQKAAIVNAFYIVNTIHDISYRYGFTEATFNFQQTNPIAAGKGNDRVIVQVQNGIGGDVQFRTPPDGYSPRFLLPVRILADSKRDGALANDLVSHEMTHGITNR
jgi:extracellular elastinolytic metalloproteinase